MIAYYQEQFRWRSWPTILDALPELTGQCVLDLGCGIGDLAAELAARGAMVIGVDINEEAIAFARNRSIPNAEFRQADLREFRDPDLCVDGIWSSFAVGYFPALGKTLATWASHLPTGGWVALTEIDDFFGHKPVSTRTRELLAAYAEDARIHSRYDFHMGSKMADVAGQVGLRVDRQFGVPDAELSFAGRAAPDVQQAWRRRFDQMKLLQEFCGKEFPAVRDDFLQCLVRDDHDCTATVKCCIAIKDRAPVDGLSVD